MKNIGRVGSKVQQTVLVYKQKSSPLISQHPAMHTDNTFPLFVQKSMISFTATTRLMRTGTSQWKESMCKSIVEKKNHVVWVYVV